jgi:thioredoxin-like negative regulator of GroEL
MKVVALYHPNSEWARSVEEYARDFEHQRGKKIELASLEVREGAALASLYDITRFPALVALRDDGEMLAMWQGEQLPLMNEVAAYLD